MIKKQDMQSSGHVKVNQRITEDGLVVNDYCRVENGLTLEEGMAKARKIAANALIYNLLNRANNK
jgi:hypothetical protein